MTGDEFTSQLKEKLADPKYRAQVAWERAERQRYFLARMGRDIREELEPPVPPPPVQPLVQVIEHRHSDMSQKDFAQLQEAIAEVKYLRKKVSELAEKKQRPKGSAYKGIK